MSRDDAISAIPAAGVPPFCEKVTEKTISLC